MGRIRLADSQLIAIRSANKRQPFDPAWVCGCQALRQCGRQDAVLYPEPRSGVGTDIDHLALRTERCAMKSGGNNQKLSVTRRDFLRTSSLAAGTVGLAPVISAPFVSKALAADTALTIV